MGLAESAVEAERISSFLGLSLEFILSLEQKEEGNILWTGILQKVEEYEELKRSKVVLEVNYEQETHAANRRLQSIEKKLETSLEDNKNLKEQSTLYKTTSEKLETEIAGLRSSNTELKEQVYTLESRNRVLESEKREVIEVIERKTQEILRQEEEYQNLTERYDKLRKEINSIENENHELKDKEISWKFKEQTSMQEIELLKKNIEWLNKEVEEKTNEFSEYRKDKLSQISSLQLELENTVSASTIHENSANASKKQLEKTSNKLEETLFKLKECQDKIVEQEESFRNEMDLQHRLTELLEQNLKNSKQRITELEEHLDEDSTKEGQEALKWMNIAEKEKIRADTMESQVEELELRVEKLQVELVVAKDQLSQGINDENAPVGVGLLSPSAQAANKLKKSGMSLTKLYSEYISVKEQLESEKKQNEIMQNNLNDLLSDLETRAPQIHEQREEFSRLQVDIADISEMLQESNELKEKIGRENKTLKIHIKDLEQEKLLYLQQTRDLSRQIQCLLYEMEVQNYTGVIMTEEEKSVIKKISESDVIEPTDTHFLISERLTLFKDIKTLQEQNQNLLKVIRELGSRMEKEELENRERLENLESAAITEANNVIEDMKEEMKKLKIKMDSYIRERDMFRRMLVYNGQADPLSSNESETNESDTISAIKSQNALRELQIQFDQYRNETSINNKILSQQLRETTNNNSNLQIQLAKMTSQLELFSERYNMLSENADILRNERDNIGLRNQQMQETLAKQDLKLLHLSEEVIEFKSTIDNLRTETANLKAEKQLWKNIETRLNSDNENLILEKNRLNKLLSDLQVILNEKERIDSESRRRLIEQNESIEKELQQIRHKATEENEEYKKLMIRKENEFLDYQSKIDNLTTKYSETYENLLAAQTSQQNLQSKVDELSILLKSTEEKLQVYQKNTTETSENNETLSKEQQLEIEIMNLRSSLDIAKSEAVQAKKYADQMKLISHAAEETLQDMNNIHDEYKVAVEKSLSDKENNIKELTEKIKNISEELENSKKELLQFETSQNEQRENFDNEKKELIAKIERLEEIEKLSIKNQNDYKEDLQKQFQISQEARSSYERELVAHAETTNNLQLLRQENSDLKTEILTLNKDNESFKFQLSTSENSWKTLKDNYEKELQDIKTRCNELVQQNNLLHNQFENISLQALKLQKVANEDNTHDLNDTVTSDKSTEDLKEIVRFLRREKEIVDCQYELSIQENKRIKHELSKTLKSLDDVRLTLNSERQQKNELVNSTSQYQDLMSKVNELNILRESNTVLRTENKINVEKLKEHEKSIQNLTSQIQPLEDQLRMLQAEQEVKESQLKLIQEDNERWKNRVQQILQKHGQTDPDELKNLKDKFVLLETENSKILQEHQTAKEEIEKLNLQNTNLANAWKAKYDRLIAQSKEKIQTIRSQILQKTQELEIKTKSEEELKKQIAQLQETISKEQGASIQEKNKTDKLENPIISLENEKIKWDAEKKSIQDKFQEEIQAKEKIYAEKLAELEKIKETNDLETKKLKAKALVFFKEKNSALEELKKANAQLSKLQDTIQLLKDSNTEELIKKKVEERISELEKNKNEEIELQVNNRIKELQKDLENKGAKITQDIKLDENFPKNLNNHDMETIIYSHIEKEKEQWKEDHKQELLAREAELKKIHEEKLKAFIEQTKKNANTSLRASPIKEQIEKLLSKRLSAELSKAQTGWENETQVKIKEALEKQELQLKNKHTQDIENLRKENEMRNKLKLSKAEKQISDLKSKIMLLESKKKESSQNLTEKSNDNPKEHTETKPDLMGSIVQHFRQKREIVSKDLKKQTKPKHIQKDTPSQTDQSEPIQTDIPLESNTESNPLVSTTNIQTPKELSNTSDNTFDNSTSHNTATTSKPLSATAAKFVPSKRIREEEPVITEATPTNLRKRKINESTDLNIKKDS
ncbi:hypothetical protein T552_03228 [Pneumocystis carinii B80]|uniref:Uncharacterized protein n=1 Tax=Pneumocystis carinii (strain B80) TaxID=1408658 RepID=A0A0W4ZCF0_PNEC8|nr:hypothetical protein T552_03228 [Pneumocystis carinii B80]KTW25953.1 hypothetical protein T552_03228 [Pneumocystis carinii B80]